MVACASVSSFIVCLVAVCLHLLFLLAASVMGQNWVLTSLDIRAALGEKPTLRNCFEVAPLPLSSAQAGRAPFHNKAYAVSGQSAQSNQ